jgi:hypothetical protein
MNADGSKLVFCWTPAFDCWWSDSSRFDPTKLEIRDAPEERVFVVIVSPNSMKAKYPAVDCWIEHWNWVRRSDVVASAPEDYQNRYSEQLK